MIKTKITFSKLLKKHKAIKSAEFRCEKLGFTQVEYKGHHKAWSDFPIGTMYINDDGVREYLSNIPN